MNSPVVKLESTGMRGTKLENRVGKTKVTPTLISLLETTRGDEVTTTCTHDSDVASRPRSVHAADIDRSRGDGNPRRSSRTRRASTKFDPSDFDSVVDVRARAGPSKRSAGPSAVTPKCENVNANRKPNSTKRSELELVSPEFLVSLLDEYNNIVIYTGRYGVKMPIGPEPEDYVIIDGVDYLRSLGYSEKITEAFIEEVVYEPQRALKEEPNSEDERVKEEQFSDAEVIHEISSADSDDSQHDIDTSTSPLAQISHDDSSNSEVDIEGLEQGATFATFSHVDLRKKPTSSKAYKRRLPGDTRIIHNEMERHRRRELANMFSRLLNIINLENNEGSLTRKLPKVRILEIASNVVMKLKREQEKLKDIRVSLLHKKMTLIEEQETLQALVPKKNKQPPTRAKQPMNKKAKQ